MHVPFRPRPAPLCMCTCTPLRIEERILGRLSVVVVRWCRWMFPFDELLPNSIQSSDAARVRRVPPPFHGTSVGDDTPIKRLAPPASRTRWTPLRPFSAPSPPPPRRAHRTSSNHGDMRRDLALIAWTASAAGMRPQSTRACTSAHPAPSASSSISTCAPMEAPRRTRSRIWMQTDSYRIAIRSHQRPSEATIEANIDALRGLHRGHQRGHRRGHQRGHHRGQQRPA